MGKSWEKPKTADFYMEQIRHISSTLIFFKNPLTVAFLVDANYITTLKAYLKREVVEETILLIESEPEKPKALLCCLSTDDRVLTANAEKHARKVLDQIPPIDVISFDDRIADVSSDEFNQEIQAVGFFSKLRLIWSTIMPACLGPGPGHSTCPMESRPLVPG